MRLLTIIGTRPEAIKMAPVLQALRARNGVTSLLALTGQHRDLVHAPLDFFGIKPDVELSLGDQAQDPIAFVERATPELARLLDMIRPDWVIVQGDTASAMAGAEAAARCALPLAHVEAGLRTHCDLPWPEEPFRRAIDAMADLLLAPTELSALNLRDERAPGSIHITGNSGIDALHAVIDRLGRDLFLRRRCEDAVPTDRPFILVTLHRRENIGSRTDVLCAALLALAESIDIVMPLHPNPLVADRVRRAVSGHPAIHLLPPQDPPAIVTLMRRSRLVLTDSGGLQEEAPSLGKRVLVLRDETERPEGIAAGISALMPSGPDSIARAVHAELCRPDIGVIGHSPYGDGKAADRIVSALLGEPFTPFGVATQPLIATPTIFA